MSGRPEPHASNPALPDAWVIEELRRREHEEQERESRRQHLELPPLPSSMEPEEGPERPGTRSVIVIAL